MARRSVREPMLWIKITCWVGIILISFWLCCIYIQHRAEEREKMKNPYYAEWVAEQEELNSWKNTWPVNVFCLLIIYIHIGAMDGFHITKAILSRLILYFEYKHKEAEEKINQEYYEEYLENKKKWDDFYAGYETRKAEAEARENEERIRQEKEEKEKRWLNVLSERRKLATRRCDLRHEFKEKMRLRDEAQEYTKELLSKRMTQVAQLRQKEANKRFNKGE